MGSNAPVRQGTLSVRLVDVRRGVQAIADAGSFNAVRFELRNPNKLVKPLVKGVSASGTTYEEVFTNLPSDPQDGYTLSVSLFNEVTSPADLADPGYANPDHLVGTGLSQPFSLQPGVNTTITVTINAVGELTFSSAVSTVDPSAPTLKPRDKTAKVLLGIDEHLNPDATELRYAVVNAAGATESVKTLERANWAALPTQTELPFTAPTATGSYRFVVDMLNGDELLSRRASAFDVALMPISSTPVKVVELPEDLNVTEVFPNEHGGLYIHTQWASSVNSLEDNQPFVYVSGLPAAITTVTRDHEGNFAASVAGQKQLLRASKAGGSFGILSFTRKPSVGVHSLEKHVLTFNSQGALVYIDKYYNKPAHVTNMGDETIITHPDDGYKVTGPIAVDHEDVIYFVAKKFDSQGVYAGFATGYKTDLALSSRWEDPGSVTALVCDDQGDVYYGVSFSGPDKPAGKVYRFRLRGYTHELFAENINVKFLHFDHATGYLCILDDSNKVHLYR